MSHLCSDSGFIICSTLGTSFLLILFLFIPSKISKLYISHRRCQKLVICINIYQLAWWLSGKEYACNAGDAGLIPGLGRSPGEGNGNPFQYSCLEIPWTEEPGGLLSMGSQRVRYYWAHTHRQIYTVKVTKLPCVKLIGRLKDNSSKIICISSKNTQTKMKYDVKISKCGGGRGE